MVPASGDGFVLGDLLLHARHTFDRHKAGAFPSRAIQKTDPARPQSCATFCKAVQGEFSQLYRVSEVKRKNHLKVTSAEAK